jgi:antitoxin ParD1/3/4
LVEEAQAAGAQIMLYIGRDQGSYAMDISVGKRWEDFIDALVQSGRYTTATEVIREGLRLMEEREAKLKSLRETVDASLAEEGLLTDEEVEAELNAHFEMRKSQAARCEN